MAKDPRLNKRSAEFDPDIAMEPDTEEQDDLLREPIPEVSEDLAPAKITQVAKPELSPRMEKARKDIRAAMGMKKGGKVSSASKRGDGIATKGKTKGRFV